MPLFSFRCTSCDHQFEALVRGSDTPVCAACGSAELSKLVSRIAPEGKSGQFIRNSRAAAAKEGHFSNCSAAERSRLLKT